MAIRSEDLHLSIPNASPLFSKLAFYTNSLDTKTSGMDIVAVYDLGQTDFSLAMNTNNTEIVESRLVGGEDPLSDDTKHNIENNLPKIRVTASVNHNISQKLSAMARVNCYGETIDERGDREVVDPTQLVDLELNYRVSNNLNIVFGSNNILNTYPPKIATRASQGMPYPRRTPIGYHGGMTYLRLMYSF